MSNYLDHPGEEILERFLLHQSGEEETEQVETHIMACESCVTRLEQLETDIAAMKLALAEMRTREAEKSFAAQSRTRNAWFTLPRLSMAGGLAALALGLLIAPQLRNHDGRQAQLTLVAYRGLETPVVPVNRPVHVSLNAEDLKPGTVVLEMVDADGKQLWTGSAVVQNDHVTVDVPKIAAAGDHFFRLYAPGPNGRGELLREFSFEAK